MNTLSFSVLMSVYAKEKPAFLDASLHSCLIEQTLLPDELVLVCDGPLTPELDAVISKYEHDFQNMHVFRLPKNGGLGRALHYGLRKCHFEWVARMDSDDVCAPNRFALQLGYLQAHPEVDILGGWIEEFDQDWKKPVCVKRQPAKHADICQKAKLRNPINHVTVMLRRQRILDCGSYMHLPYVEDYYLWMRAAVAGLHMANLDEILVHVRIGNGMTTRRGNRAYITSWRTLNRFMRKHRMISVFEYIRNMLAIVAFVYMPASLKQWVYKHLLRR